MKRKSPIIICIDCKRSIIHYSKDRCKRCYNKFYKQHKIITSGKIKCACGKCDKWIYRVNNQLKENKYHVGHFQVGQKYSKERIEKMKLGKLKNSNIYKKRSNTKPEKLLENELNKLGLLVIKQKFLPISNTIHSTDFFIPPNIIIEVDGDYWHRLPNMIIRDKIVNQELRKQGYKILRFWEKDVYLNINWVMKCISTMIGREGYLINDIIDCACECGGKLKKYDKWGDERRFIRGHQHKRSDYGLRICEDCKSTITYTKVLDTGTICEEWKILDENKFLCKKCTDKRYRFQKKLMSIPT